MASFDRPTWWQRLTRWLASTRIGMFVFSHTLHHLDALGLALTAGRVHVSRVLGGVPVIRLTATGAKTGKKRTLPLIGVPDGENVILVASNWGRERHPAWYHNLRANPQAQIGDDGRTRPVIAHEATGAEYDRCWRKAVSLYPPYAAYRRRVQNRHIPLMVLEPTPSGS